LLTYAHFFLYFLKTQNDHVNLFVNDGKVKYNILTSLKEKNAQSLLGFDTQWHVTYENMMSINEVQNNSMHVILFEVCTLSSILNLSGIVIWIL
jgi:ABC-type lipoprotein release transport system permease subunit